MGLLKLTPSQRLRLMPTTVSIMDMDWPTTDMDTDWLTTDTMDTPTPTPMVTTMARGLLMLSPLLMPTTDITTATLHTDMPTVVTMATPTPTMVTTDTDTITKLFVILFKN